MSLGSENCAAPLSAADVAAVTGNNGNGGGWGGFGGDWLIAIVMLFLFPIETGAPLEQWRANQRFSSLVRKAGLEGVRFHDLRHTYAVNALRAGDDIKSVQGNLGHATAAFTLDRYAHFTEQMKQASADRMETFIKTALSM